MDSKIFVTFVLGPKSLIRDGQIIFFCKTGLYLKLSGESFNFTFNRILRFIYTSDKKRRCVFILSRPLLWIVYIGDIKQDTAGVIAPLFTYLGCRVAQGGQGKYASIIANGNTTLLLYRNKL
jgi:hypothetical protein